jgi:UDP:flavonoid glycosyltransferase YjiC (YdhE family)
MRVLFTSTPGAGHIHPLVPLASELQASGHEVVWATAADGCARVERYGFRALPAGMSLQDRTSAFRERKPDIFSRPPRERREVFMPEIFGVVAAPRMRDDLIAIFADYRPDLVVHDLAELAAAPLACAGGIPHVTVAYSGRLSSGLQAGLVESVAELWVDAGVPVTETAGLYDHLYLHSFPAALGGAETHPNAHPMRAMQFDGAATSERPEWVESFGAERPGVYVTFGTETASRSRPEQLLDALGGADADVVYTAGSRPDASSIDSIPANVRVEQYVPQSFLLDRAQVVVSHAGAGTLLAAAAHGRPQLCIPFGADQWENADAVTGSGAGITLETDQRDAGTICASVERLLKDTTFHAAARRVADDLEALPHPRDYVGMIEVLTRD